MTVESLLGDQSEFASGEIPQPVVPGGRSAKREQWDRLLREKERGETVNFEAFRNPGSPPTPPETGSNSEGTPTVKPIEGTVLAPDRKLVSSSGGLSGRPRGILAIFEPHRRENELFIQFEEVNRVLERVTGAPIDWPETLQRGLEAFYEEHNVLPKLQHDLLTPQGMATAMGEIFPRLTAACMAAPVVADKRAYGQVARAVEDERAQLARKVEEDNHGLRELREENRKRLEGQIMTDEEELARSYIESAPVFNVQAEKKKDLKAAASGITLTVIKAWIEQAFRLPPAALKGFGSELIEWAREHPVAAASVVPAVLAAGIVPLALGLSGLWALPIFSGTVAAGAVIEGIISRGSKKPKKSDSDLSGQPVV